MLEKLEVKLVASLMPRFSLSNMHLSGARGRFSSSSSVRPSVSFILGGPASGKGTQCEKLALEFGMKHVSAGQLLRDEVNNPNSKNGGQISQILKDGQIVPAEITVSLLENCIKLNPLQRILIDGFPRNLNNLECWLQNAYTNSCDIEKVVFIDVSLSELRRRLLLRGSNGSGRSDDNLDTASRRFQVFQDSTMPMLVHPVLQPLVYKIDGEKAIDQVYSDVRKLYL